MAENEELDRVLKLLRSFLDIDNYTEPSAVFEGFVTSREYGISFQLPSSMYGLENLFREYLEEFGVDMRVERDNGKDKKQERDNIIRLVDGCWQQYPTNPQSFAKSSRIVTDMMAEFCDKYDELLVKKLEKIGEEAKEKAEEKNAKIPEDSNAKKKSPRVAYNEAISDKRKEYAEKNSGKLRKELGDNVKKFGGASKRGTDSWLESILRPIAPLGTRDHADYVYLSRPDEKAGYYYDASLARKGKSFSECIISAESDITPFTKPLLGTVDKQSVLNVSEMGCPNFEHNLEIMIPNELERDWFIKLAAASLIGRSKVYKVFVDMWGASGAGKTTLFQIFRHVFNNNAVYGFKDGGGFYSDISAYDRGVAMAVLDDYSMVYVDEADAKPLDNVFLKEYTGAESTGARYMNKGWSDAETAHVLFFCSNSGVRWNQSMEGLPDRYVCINFPNGAKERAEKGLTLKTVTSIEKESVGILRKLHDAWEELTREVVRQGEAGESSVQIGWEAIEARNWSIDIFIPKGLKNPPKKTDTIKHNPIGTFVTTLVNSGIIRRDDNLKKKDMAPYSKIKSFWRMYSNEHDIRRSDGQLRQFFQENDLMDQNKKQMVISKYAFTDEFLELPPEKQMTMYRPTLVLSDDPDDDEKWSPLETAQEAMNRMS